MSLDYTIRLYELLADGSIESLGGGEITSYGSSCPNVGDTIARYDVLAEAFKFYNVQRRMFIDSADSDEGWAIIVRATAASSLMLNVTDEWLDETKFWRDVEDQERQEKHDEAARTQGTLEYFTWQAEERVKHRPLFGLNGREIDVLLYMVKHPRRKLIEQIPRAGQKTMEKFSAIGVVKNGGTSSKGEQEWSITKEGREELKRHEKWANWGK